MKKILIVDDSVSLRKDLKRFLQPIENIEIVGEASNSADAVRKHEALKPDIIILDIDLKSGNGIEVLTKIKKCLVPSTVIMFTNYSNYAFQKAAERLGANYFLDKTKDVDRLVDILKELAD